MTTASPRSPPLLPRDAYPSVPTKHGSLTAVTSLPRGMLALISRSGGDANAGRHHPHNHLKPRREEVLAAPPPLALAPARRDKGSGAAAGDLAAIAREALAICRGDGLPVSNDISDSSQAGRRTRFSLSDAAPKRKILF